MRINRNSTDRPTARSLRPPRPARVPNLATIAAALLMVATLATAQRPARITPTSGQQTAPAGSNAAAPHALGVGEVIGDDVYVRSGPSANHYPVAKLHKGDRVTLMGRSDPWLLIAPPKGAFSLIATQYIDTTDGKRGVINGDNVRVRAGSVIEEFAKNKYAVQSKLSRGATVTILAKHDDDYTRVVPPAGVTVCIHRDYVRVLSDELLEGERAATAPIDPGAIGESSEATAAPPAGAVPGETGSHDTSKPAPAIVVSEQRQELDRIDTDARAEVAKPLLDRNLNSLIARYEAIAGDNEDPFAARYARRRVDQLAYLDDLLGAVRRVRAANQEIEAKRRAFMEERASLPKVAPSLPAGFDIKGELRRSALYPAGSTPQRYRLVDQTRPAARTIAYIEIAPGSKINAKDFIGQYVGVRASRKFLAEGTVDPVVVYVASELVALKAEASLINQEQPEG